MSCFHHGLPVNDQPFFVRGGRLAPPPQLQSAWDETFITYSIDKKHNGTAFVHVAMAVISSIVSLSRGMAGLQGIVGQEQGKSMLLRGLERE